MQVTYRSFVPSGNDEPSHSVTFESDRFAGALVLHFHLLRRGGGTTEPVNVGFELRESRESGPQPGAAGTVETTFEIEDAPYSHAIARRRQQTGSARPIAIDPEALERIVLDYQRYLQIARATLQMQDPWPSDDERRTLVDRARRKGRGRRGLDREFFELLADEVKQRETQGDTAIATSIAKAHFVNRSTASRWLKRLESEGYLTKPESND